MQAVCFGWLLVGLVPLVGCAGEAERSVVKDASAGRARAPSFYAPPPTEPSAGEPPSGRGHGQSSLGAYVATAMERSPELRAAFERWRAAVLRISQSRQLPDPQISFGYFVQSVETRVGPQRARVSLRQSFPWPTQLTAGADAAAARARAAQKRAEALALSIKQRVEEAYFHLWLIRETRRIHGEHLLVLRALSESVLARVATGASSLADQQQVDLAAARLEDMVRGMDEAEATAIARLHAAMGVQSPAKPPTKTGPPPPLLPGESEEALREAVGEHPLIASYGQMATSSEEMARAKKAERLPSFSLGADWIITGESPMAGVDDSGKDAIVVGGGMTLPLWQGIYADQVDAARAEASAQRADQAAAEDLALAELQASLAAVRDSVRRVRLYQTTLVPQADSAYASVLGAFATGEGTVAQTLLAQRDLLELKAELSKARADHALAWTRLERVVGRAVKTAEAQPHPEKNDED